MVEDFTPIFEGYADARLSFTEAEALRPFHDAGEPARLREDIRFRSTPWGRWMRADRWLMNERLAVWMAAQGLERVSLDEVGVRLATRMPMVFCPGDPRFRLAGAEVHLTEVGRPKGGPRRRVLASDRLDGRAATLRRRLLEERGPGAREEEGGASEESWPPCELALEEDGLHLIIPPISAARIPPYVRLLRLDVSPLPIELPLPLLRSGHEEVIPLSTSPYTWSGFSRGDVPLDEDDALLVQELNLPGLAAAAVSVFEVGEDGRHWLTARQSLSPGRSYRLLFPPDLEVPEGVLTSPAGLWQDAWRVWTLQVPVEISLPLAHTLAALGLSVGSPELRLRWLGAPPSAWSFVAGSPAPVFDPRDELLVSLEGLPAGGATVAAALLIGERSDVRLELTGEATTLRLEGLAPGRFGLEVIPVDLNIPRARLWFEVRDHAGAPPRALLRVLWTALASQDGEELDLREALLDRVPEGEAISSTLRSTEIVAPPLWPVTLTWRGLTSPRAVSLRADRDGRILSALGSLACEIQSSVAGRLEIDAREIERFVFQHRHLPTPDEICVHIARLLPGAIGGLPDDPRLLQDAWFRPLLENLGYRLGQMEATSHGAVSWPLRLVVSLEDPCKIETRGLLVLLRHGEQPSNDLVVRRTVKLLRDRELSMALVTDGLIWRRVSSRRVAGPIFKLDEVLSERQVAEIAAEALTAELP